MTNILKSAQHRESVKDRDLKDEYDTEGNKKLTASYDDKVFGKDKAVEAIDPFFVEAAVAEDKTTNKVHEKREVMRDGRVPKFQKNVEKQEQRQIEAQTRREGWIAKKEEKKLEV